MGIVKEFLYKISAAAYLPLFKKQPIFPYYHLIKDTSRGHIKHLYPYKNVAQFIEDIDFIERNYVRLDPADLLKGDLPENAYLFTFDDGLEEVYSVVFPILMERGIKAIFFINPNFVGDNAILYKHQISLLIEHLIASDFQENDLKRINTIFPDAPQQKETLKNYLLKISYADRFKLSQLFDDFGLVQKHNSEKFYVTEDNIREMIAAGYYFGGHTMSHPPLDQLSYEEQKAEIIDSIDWVKKTFDIKYSMFAFPFSDKKISKKLMFELLNYDPDIFLFGNSGMKSDISNRIIQRFSLEKPGKDVAKLIVHENLYKYFNKIIGSYNIKRNG